MADECLDAVKNLADDDFFLQPESLSSSRKRSRTREPKKFPCPNCSSGFTYEKGLVQHIKYECGQKPRFKCPYCEHRSKWMNNVYKHVRTRHDGEEVKYVTSPERI